jgi:hypothetical protein
MGSPRRGGGTNGIERKNSVGWETRSTLVSVIVARTPVDLGRG